MLQGLLIDMHDARNSQLILEKILGRVTTLMNAHRSDFVLWDDDQNDLIVTAVYGERVSQTVKVGQSFPQNSFIRALWDDKNSNFRMSSNVLTEKAYYESDPRVKSEIAIRLELEDQPIGIFNIEALKKSFSRRRP